MAARDAAYWRAYRAKRPDLRDYQRTYQAERRGVSHPPNYEKWCPSCKMKWRVPVPAEYHMVRLTPMELRTVRHAAVLFDELSGEDRFSAEDFVVWLAADVRES